MEKQQAQEPIGYGFGAANTAEDVIKGIDLKGKTAIVTGGYSGIGLETTRILVGAGATVIVPARDQQKAAAAVKGLGTTEAKDPGTTEGKGLAGVELASMDLIDPASIDAFADAFLASGRPLHLLINSAGIMASPLMRDARGYESQFATNHLGHFQLTARLWPALLKAGNARIVNVSSWGHRYSPVNFEDPNFEHRAYEPWSAYGQSKTANILHAVGLDKRGKNKGIRAFAVHPGTIVSTDLSRYLTMEQLQKAGAIDADGNPVLDPSRQMKTIAQGAATSIWCATSPILAGMGGLYCENSDVSPLIVDENKEIGTSWGGVRMAERPTGALGVYPYAVDPEAAERLWELSERLTDKRG
jgi:NAD(P)-dependent dehydrogenase (short-subunit alcohol dehydrogenase family)